MLPFHHRSDDMRWPDIRADSNNACLPGLDEVSILITLPLIQTQLLNRLPTRHSLEIADRQQNMIAMISLVVRNTLILTH